MADVGSPHQNLADIARQSATGDFPMKFSHDHSIESGLRQQAVLTGESNGKSERIRPRETVLVVLVAANLCFLAWAYGGVETVPQVISAGLSLAALLVALLSRVRWDAAGGREDNRIKGWRRAIRLPAFWAGPILFSVVALQAFNPAFEYHLAGAEWWLTRINYLHWLPSGMTAPFAESNPWRALLVWVPAWAAMCAVWIGISHRSAIRLLLTALVANAFALAAFGLVQRAGGVAAIYGVRGVPSAGFFAAFVYKNHAAAYFALLASVSVSLAVDAAWRSQLSTHRPGPAILFVFFTLVLALAVGLTLSISGIALLVLFAVLVVPVTIWRFTRSFRKGTTRAPALVTAATLLVIVAALGAAIGSKAFPAQIQARFFVEGGLSLRPRWLADQRGWAMFEDRWIFGWGAGCFRYGFTKYQHAEPELTGTGSVHYKWEHVHDDWLELLIELGVIGVLPIAIVMGYVFRQLVRLRVWRSPVAFPMVVGLGLLCLDALVDFPFQNPAILMTACALIPLVIRWSETENQGNHR